MKREAKLLFVAALLCLFIMNSAVSAGDGSSSPVKYWRVLHSDGNGVELLVTVPEPLCSEDQYNGKVYQKFTIAGLPTFSPAGAPELPGISLPLFVPAGKHVEVDWEGNSEQLSLSHDPLPRPTVVFSPDAGDGVVEQEEKVIESPEYYAMRHWFPESPVSLGPESFLRQVKVCTLNVSPLQVLVPQRQARLYRELKIRIRFKATSQIQDKKLRPFRLSDEQQSLLPFYHELGINSDALEQGLISLQGRPSLSTATRVAGEALIPNWYRISIHQKGMHQITRSQLVVAGMPVSSVDPRQLAIYKGGQEIAIRIIGEDDGVFDTNDLIIFYGTGMNDAYTLTNCYWLTKKSSNGLRMGSQDVSPVTAYPEIISFTESLHFEENHEYQRRIPGGAGLDHWFWEVMIAPLACVYSFAIPAAADVTNATMRVVMQGWTFNTSINPDHHIRVLINNHQTYSGYWDGQIPVQFTFPILLADTIPGTNELKIVLDGDVSPNEAVYVNYFEIDYTKLFQAQADHLAFSLAQSGQQKLSLMGFTSSLIALFDITDAAQVVRLVNGQIQNVSGTYQLTFSQDLSTVPRTYETVTDTTYLAIDSIIKDVSSQLHATTNGADYIIIAPTQFHAILGPLVTHRQNQGYRVMLVDIQDIYDEFSDGVFTPDAITAFLTYAYTFWQTPPPLYVFLVGEANSDYFDAYATGVPNLVPTHPYETMYSGETATDYPFTCVSGSDNLPDLVLGRVTPRTPEEATAIVANILGYEGQANPQAWNRNVLLIADHEVSFELPLDALETTYFNPLNITTHKVYLGDYGQANVAQAKQDIVTNTDEGRLVTIYFGHGNLDLWSGWLVFQANDVPLLNNAYRQPLLICSSCSNGYFAYYTQPTCMSEAWSRYQSKGAIVTTASTTLSFASDDDKFHHRAIQQIYQNRTGIAGAVIQQALILALLNDYLSVDMLTSQSVIGDPLTHLLLPEVAVPELQTGGLLLLLLGLSFLLFLSLRSARTVSSFTGDTE